MPHLFILGAGPAGLALGYYACREGLPCTVFERATRVGGAAITLEHEGFAFDSGAHRLHDKDPEVTADVIDLLDGEIDQVRVGSRIYSDGTYFDFPLSPVNLARGLGVVGLARASWDLAWARRRSVGPGASFEEAACRTYGRSIADRFLLRYTEKLWGRPAGELAPAVSGGRLEGLDLRATLGAALRPARRRPAHLDGVFYYPRRGGIGTVAERLAAAIGRDRILLGREVTGLVHDSGSVRAIITGDRRTDLAGFVVSTLPLPRLMALLAPSPPAEVVDAARELRFRSLVVVALFLDRDTVTRDATVYFPAPQFLFTRVSEPRNRNLGMVPPGRTSLVAEIPCDLGDETWRADDEHLACLVTRQLASIDWVAPRDVLGHAVHRIEHAYPVLTLHSHEALATVKRYLGGFANLRSVGRNGAFAYSHLHHQFRTARQTVAALKTVLESGA